MPVFALLAAAPRPPAAMRGVRKEDAGHQRRTHRRTDHVGTGGAAGRRVAGPADAHRRPTDETVTFGAFRDRAVPGGGRPPRHGIGAPSPSSRGSCRPGSTPSCSRWPLRAWGPSRTRSSTSTASVRWASPFAQTAAVLLHPRPSGGDSTYRQSRDGRSRVSNRPPHPDRRKEDSPRATPPTPAPAPPVHGRATQPSAGSTTPRDRRRTRRACATPTRPCIAGGGAWPSRSD